MTIWKYELPITDVFSIAMPKEAQILCVQTQFNKPVMYALVDPTNEREQGEFKMHGTGHPIHNIDNYQYIGTFQINNGSFVFHVFEVVK